jgi:SAM-dependent methyltransferase
MTTRIATETRSTVYSRDFFANRQHRTKKAAEPLVAAVLEYIQPERVIDVGCGTGEFLAVLREHGVQETRGIDGAYVDRALLAIPQEDFVPLDLNRPFTLEQSYDLALCLEVAEHLEPSSAADLVASLTRLAPVILFSAAIPYQGGNGHLNEQWPEYWAQLFRQHGYVPVDALRRKLWNNEQVDFWYRQNMLFFCTEQALQSNVKLAEAARATQADALSMVHPLWYLECNTKYLRMLRHFLVYLNPLWRLKQRLIRSMTNAKYPKLTN